VGDVDRPANKVNMAKQLTATQLKYIALDKRKAEIKQFYEDLKVVTKELVDEIGIDAYFQDEEGTVYKTFVPNGKFVAFETLSVKRTKKNDEVASGSNLSKKEAKEQGFDV
jgi:hypothetical protein